MATEAMKPQHQPVINSNFPLLESGKYRMSDNCYRKVVESVTVSSLLMNDQFLVMSESKPVSEVLMIQITSTSNLDEEKARNIQEPKKFNKVYTRLRRQSKWEQDSSSKQPCKLADTVDCLLENQTSITVGETEKEVVHKQETRSENKDDDHNLDVSKNEVVTCDDIVAVSSNKEEKEKQVEKDLGSSKPWNLRSSKNSSHVLSDKSTNADLKTEGNVEKEIKEKLSVLLTREECEEDFFLMTGSNPPRQKQRKSNKRSREQNKIFYSLFPGLKFHGMNADSYKIPKR